MDATQAEPEEKTTEATEEYASVTDDAEVGDNGDESRSSDDGSAGDVPSQEKRAKDKKKAHKKKKAKKHKKKKKNKHAAEEKQGGSSDSDEYTTDDGADLEAQVAALRRHSKGALRGEDFEKQEPMVEIDGQKRFLRDVILERRQLYRPGYRPYTVAVKGKACPTSNKCV